MKSYQVGQKLINEATGEVITLTKEEIEVANEATTLYNDYWEGYHPLQSKADFEAAYADLEKAHTLEVRSGTGHTDILLGGVQVGYITEGVQDGQTFAQVVYQGKTTSWYAW